MLQLLSSVSRSAVRRPPSTSGNVNSLLRPKLARFCVCRPSEPTKDSIEIKLPEVGERLEAIGVREQPLTTHHLHHMSPSGRLEVLGGGRSPAAYARRQRSAALRAETKQPEVGERLEAIGLREQPNSRKILVRSSVGMQ
jgi:hypothetical protein